MPKKHFWLKSCFSNLLFKLSHFVWPLYWGRWGGVGVVGVRVSDKHCLLFFFPFSSFMFCSERHPLRKKASFSAASPCEKKLAFLQHLRSSDAAEKLCKSFVKAGGIGTCGKAGFYAGLQKSRLLRSFYATLRKSCRKASFSTAFTQSFVKIIMMSKSCGNAAITQVPIPPAFAKLLHAAFTCVKAAFIHADLRFYSFYAGLRKSCVKPAFQQKSCVFNIFDKKRKKRAKKEWKWIEFNINETLLYTNILMVTKVFCNIRLGD